LAFTGKAVYDSGVFPEIAEDIAPTIAIISPHETPFLDSVGDAQYPAESVIHQYMEAQLAPSSIIPLLTVDDSVVVLTSTPGLPAGQLMNGTIIENETTGEYILVNSGTDAGTMAITRGFGGTTAATIATTHTLSVLFNAALEGADVAQDIAVPRTRKANLVQLFKKDIIVSGTIEAVSMAAGVSNELNFQIVSRSREILRDLERAAIRGIMSTTTLGSASAYRSMAGLWQSITTNVRTYTAGSVAGTVVNGWVKAAWENGARDLDLLMVGKNLKDELDGLLETQRRVIAGQSGTRNVERIVETFESTYGVMRIMLNRWMRPGDAIVTSTRRVKVLPLKNRSFRFEQIAKTGDATKGMIVGEYTMEIWNQDGMTKAYAA
jgi:hypothetical protein